MASLKNFVPFVDKLNKAYGDVKNLLGIELEPYGFYVDHGVHHHCWYDIIINIPEAVQARCRQSSGQTLSTTKLTERLNMMCIDISTPQPTIQSDPIYVGGEPIEIPYQVDYGTFTTSFYIDSGYADDAGVTLKTFTNWVATVFDPSTHTFGYMSDYATDVKITLYSTPDGNPSFDKEKLVEYTIKGAWPHAIQSVQLSGKSSEATEFQVTWKFRNYTVDVTPEGFAQGLATLVKNGFRLGRSIKNFVKNAKTTYRSVTSAVKEIF